MPTVELTGHTAPSLECLPGATETTYWADDLPGFGLRCRASGGRSWFVQYRTKLGQTRKHALGDPGVVSFAKARKEAGRLLAAAKLGGDPAGDVKNAKASVTIRELATTYMAQQKAGMKPRSYDELARHLETHAKSLHSRRADQVTRRDAVELLQGIAATAPVTANRVRASLSAMFAWGMQAGLVAANPIAATFKPADEKPRERVLTDAELALVWSCTAGDADYDRIVRLLLLTGARRQEIAGMQREELTRHSDGTATWVLPSERSKNRLPHELVFPPTAADLLPKQRDRADGKPRELLFGGGDGPFSGWSRCKDRLDARMRKALAEAFAEQHGREPTDDEAQLKPWVLHDLRRTFVTRLNDLGVEPHIIEALVNHASGSAKAGVAGVYNRSAYAPQKRAALALWCSHVARLIGDKPAPDKGADVVPLRRAG